MTKCKNCVFWDEKNIDDFKQAKCTNTKLEEAIFVNFDTHGFDFNHYETEANFGCIFGKRRLT